MRCDNRHFAVIAVIWRFDAASKNFVQTSTTTTTTDQVSYSATKTKQDTMVEIEAVTDDVSETTKRTPDTSREWQELMGADLQMKVRCCGQ